jgi:sugar lactone lactonase YvrE
MSTSAFFRTTGAAFASLVVLAACSQQSSSGTSLPTQTSAQLQARARQVAPVSFVSDATLAKLRPGHPLSEKSGWLSPAAKTCKQQLFVSSFRLNYVSIYCVVGKRQNQAPIGEITDGINGPEGAVVDAKGNLYITNTNSNTVSEYAPGTTSPSFTYSSMLSAPAGVAVDAKQNVYVSNLGSGEVIEFAQGANTAAATLTGMTLPIDVAVDAKGDVYVTTYTSSFASGEILEYAAGKTQGTNLGIATDEPGGITLDKSGDIVTADQRLPGVLVFPPGKKSPSKTFAVSMNDPISVRFNRAETRAYVGDSIENDVEVYSYPSGQLIDTITDGVDGPEGVAVYPAPPLSKHAW